MAATITDRVEYLHDSVMHSRITVPVEAERELTALVELAEEGYELNSADLVDLREAGLQEEWVAYLMGEGGAE